MLTFVCGKPCTTLRECLNFIKNCQKISDENSQLAKNRAEKFPISSHCEGRGSFPIFLVNTLF